MSKWVKNGFFVIFSKTGKPIWFHLLVKEDIIILHICAKFRVEWGSKIDLFDYISTSLYLFLIRCFLFLFNSKCTFKFSFHIRIRYSNSVKSLWLVMSVRTVSFQRSKFMSQFLSLVLSRVRQDVTVLNAVEL